MPPVLRSLVLSIQSSFNGYDALAHGASRQFRNPSLYPIFIVGAPRTGSTLLYQLIVKYMKVAFISNMMALLPKKMLFIARLTHRWMSRIEDVKDSDHGYIPGLFSPNEAGAIMRMWFDRQVEAEEKRLIQNTMVLLSDIFGAPFVNKNLFNSLRLTTIYDISPEARFINMRRNPLFTAQSILLERRKILGNEQEWLGPKPAGYQAVLEQSPLYQVLWQVKHLEDIVSEFLCKSSSTYLEVSYEEICQKPEEILNLIANRFDLNYKHRPEIDPLFVREEIRVSESEWNRLLD